MHPWWRIEYITEKCNICVYVCRIWEWTTMWSESRLRRLCRGTGKCSRPCFAITFALCTFCLSPTAAHTLSDTSVVSVWMVWWRWEGFKDTKPEKKLDLPQRHRHFQTSCEPEILALSINTDYELKAVKCATYKWTQHSLKTSQDSSHEVGWVNV